MKQFTFLTFLTFLFLSCFLNAQSQTDLIQELEELVENQQSNTYLLWTNKDTLSHILDTTHLVILPDEWETYSFKVGYGFSPNGQTTFEVSPKTAKPVKRRVSSYDKELYTEKMNALDVKALCIVEVPARHVSFKPVMIIDNGDTIMTVPNQKVVGRRLVKKGGFKYVSKEEASNIDKNDVYSLVGNVEVRQYFHTCGYRRAEQMQNRMTNIQKALNEKGYKCPVDGVFGSEMKKVLIQFQKDNNLQEGRLYIETLKALGVE